MIEERQLTIFQYIEEEITHHFGYIELDKDLNAITKEAIIDGTKYKNIIKNFGYLHLNKNELEDIVDNSIKKERINYGWYIYFKQNNKYYNLLIRFDNLTTSKRDTIYEHIDKGYEYLKEERNENEI